MATFVEPASGKLTTAVPLNAIRVFMAITREAGVTHAARALGITQSAASQHLTVLEDYLGHRLFHRRGRQVEPTDFGRLFYQAVADSMDTVEFTSRRMRRHSDSADRLIVRTSLSTFAHSTLIPNLSMFSSTHKNVTVDVVTALAPPQPEEAFDVLITGNLELPGAAEHWDLLEEYLICVGAPTLVKGKELGALSMDTPFISVTSRPDILPRWTTGLNVPLRELAKGPRYEHHFLAIPAAAAGQGLLVAPDVVVSPLLNQGVLAALPNSRVKSGLKYSAYVIDRGYNFDLSRSFCRWLAKLCKGLDHQS